MKMLLSSLLVIGLIGNAVAQETPPPTVPAADQESSLAPLARAGAAQHKAEMEIRKKLDEPAEIQAVELELSSLIKELAKTHDLQINLDPAGLDAAKVQPDMLITIDIKKISLRSALRILLRPLNLVAIIRDESLFITAADCTEMDAIARTYRLPAEMEDPRELLDTIRMAWPPTIPDLVAKETIDCRPRAVLLGNRLVVRGSPRHHEQVEQLLSDLLADTAEKPELKPLDTDLAPPPTVEKIDEIPLRNPRSLPGPAEEKPAAE